jgi:glycosyltransferase involved in cell wall biosynthesis
LKKKIFINFSRILKIYNNVVWHATSENERLEILKYFGSNVEIFKISNLSIKSEKLLYRKNICKKQGSLSIAFVSRIHPKKNLLYALSIVEKVKGEIEFNIVGPIEDKKYWSECEKKISKMPPNININYLGTVSNDLIIDEFRSNHVFLFPTLGENYGHVIIEAMLGGCPVIVSDQTPWKDLMSLNVGEDISLNNLENFTNSIQKYVGYNQEEYNHFSKNAFLYGSRCSSNKEYISEYINMFNINKEN